MAVIDRHRVARLVELSAAERTLKGPERQLREEDVKLLIRAAYDDAMDAPRADFMARVQGVPTSAWPWSAVQVMAPRGGTGVSLGGLVGVPRPALIPALLVLIRGQADSADLDPGNRLPEPGSPEFAEWEPLQRALDTWDTQTITKSIGPQGWVSMIGNTSGQAPRDTEDGATSGAPAAGTSPNPPPSSVPAPQTPPTPSELTWKHPAVIAAGVAVAVATGAVLYSLAQSRSRRELEDVLSQQEEQP
ncbi:hypothetical protein [Nannocystis bainbridge]|uniref:Uncharacterized protein n=1 Tax=Nannocystis bainbridge TaxID=2995303 RepID=A0ABT5E7S9_9BACT|nr:hypothetical protein [Nannocystis bainbridge]MDC0720887.1 hypothetical protein [Nannocystis bainbridge]